VRIYVSSLYEMPRHVRERRVGYVVSLVQSVFQPECPQGVRRERHLRIEVDDINAPADGAVLPGELHVQRLIDFLERWPGDEPLLLHCYAGISRSTAGALIALSLWQDELDAARALRTAAPHAMPNSRIIELADTILGRDGRLVAAREAMGPHELSSEGPLTELALPPGPGPPARG
jgi:predicted protein tyrosine phosphatase